METFLLVLQVVVGILLALVILVQEKGSGMGEALGGSSNSGGFQATKRGAEKVLSNATIVLLIIFLSVALILNFI
jgi:protein translocase SecG subunit